LSRHGGQVAAQHVGQVSFKPKILYSRQLADNWLLLTRHAFPSTGARGLIRNISWSTLPRYVANSTNSAILHAICSCARHPTLISMVTNSSLVTNSSRLQAGGICGTSDGRIRLPDGSHEDIEIKGSRAKSGKPNSFAFKAIRCAGTNWKHLFLVGRRREPQKWSDWADVGGAIMLGHVTRSRYEAALDKAGLSRSAPKDATVTPGSARSWLGGAVNWVRLEEADLAWWRQNVLNVSDSGPARASPVAC
jgi:hypothetical protein